VMGEAGGGCRLGNAYVSESDPREIMTCSLNVVDTATNQRDLSCEKNQTHGPGLL
jgi:hypothetical protein